MTQEAKVLVAIGAITVALVIGAVFFLSRENKPPSVNADLLMRENSNKISSDSARLTIVEFGDYQCPACGMAFPGLKQALSDYKTQVNFVYRHFPLMQHKYAEIAGAAAEAAGIQGKYWEMHNILYARQNEWSENNDPVSLFKKFAAELNLDIDKFSSDMNSDAAKKKIKDDLADGLALGVNSTPTFFFNGELYKRGISYQDFKSEIESRLK